MFEKDPTSKSHNFFLYMFVRFLQQILFLEIFLPNLLKVQIQSNKSCRGDFLCRFISAFEVYQT